MYPLALAINVNPMPVLPAVPSIIYPFWFILFSFSALFIIAKAALSFMEPPGFKNSALPYISHPVISDGYSILLEEYYLLNQ